jgi:hypothetical protein
MTFASARPVSTLEPAAMGTAENGQPKQQTIVVGPLAAFVPMKQLGTNGGGFYGMNSAHPFENPTDLTNFLSCVAMMLFPFSLVLMYGRMLKRIKHAVVIFSVMMALMIGTVVWAIYFDTLQPNPGLTAQTGGQTYEIPSATAPGGKRQVTIPSVAGLPVDQHLGNLEGKELRFGTSAGATFSALTVDVTDGAINCEHEPEPCCGALADGGDVVELHLRRKGCGDDQSAALLSRGRVCGRSDGRSNPGVPWKEDRWTRNETGNDRAADSPDHDFNAYRVILGNGLGNQGGSESWTARVFRDHVPVLVGVGE